MKHGICSLCGHVEQIDTEHDWVTCSAEGCWTVVDLVHCPYGESLPATVHATDSPRVSDADDPRTRECFGCGEVVSCKCGSD
jgi:hypothetical protein